MSAVNPDSVRATDFTCTLTVTQGVLRRYQRPNISTKGLANRALGPIYRWLGSMTAVGCAGCRD